MAAYRTVVGGTDGSDSSVRAVTRAGAPAGVVGEVRALSVGGSPVEALLRAVRRQQADLLVVGDLGLGGIEGRLPGSVPTDATRRSECDVPIVHTTG